MNSQKSTITHPTEPHLPWGQTLLISVQHIFVSNVWLDPIFVAASAGLSLALSANLVNAIFIASGVVTLIQATRLVKLPIVQGPSAAFDALMIDAGKNGLLSAAGGSVLASGLIVMLLAVTGLLTKLVKKITPEITGTIIFLVGVSLANFTLLEFLGGAPSTPSFAAPTTLLVAIVTAGLVVGLSLFAKGLWHRFSFLIALVVGDSLAAILQQIHFTGLASHAWLGLPRLLPYGALTFNWAIFLSFLIAYGVAVVEAIGVYEASAAMTQETLSPKRVRNGIMGEAAGSILSSLIGGFPTTAFAQNLGVMKLTGVHSRKPILLTGSLLLVLGFCPKLGAFLALTPAAVIGGMFLPAAATLVITGLNILKQVKRTDATDLIIGLSIILAIALPGYAADFPSAMRPLVSNQILVGAIAVTVLHICLLTVPHLIRKK